jgi:hypothetical protein
MRYQWQMPGPVLVDTAIAQVIHRGNPPAPAMNSDNPRVALSGLRTVNPAVPGAAYVNNLGQLIQKIGTDDLYYIDGEVYERLANGSFYKVPVEPSKTSGLIWLVILGFVVFAIWKR